MTTILTALDLPAPEPYKYGIWGYVRSISDRRVLIAGHSGECFMRQDGAEWEEPAYRVSRDGNPEKAGTVEREPATAYGDAGYREKKKPARAA